MIASLTANNNKTPSQEIPKMKIDISSAGASSIALPYSLHSQENACNGLFRLEIIIQNNGTDNLKEVTAVSLGRLSRIFNYTRCDFNRPYLSVQSHEAVPPDHVKEASGALGKAAFDLQLTFPLLSGGSSTVTNPILG